MITKDEAFRLANYSLTDLSKISSDIRDSAYGSKITYSPKVFIPLTQLCRDVCSYCTFAKNSSQVQKPYMTLEDVSEVCIKGINNNCSEALFTLGESPETRHLIAQEWLTQKGYHSTIDYLVEASGLALNEYGLLPHVNPGAISDKDLLRLKKVSASQGMMLETIALRLCEPGGPHFGSPDKTPARRLATLEAAGRCRVPFTTGILVGIGETRHERVEALLAIRELNERFGHIQEVIIQNFVPKHNTAMASSLACEKQEHLWSIAAARIILGDSTHIQAPPNLVDTPLDLVQAGVDDLGGISPVTKDFVNPEKPWPHLDTLNSALNEIGKVLVARASIYPEFIDKIGFVDDSVVRIVKKKVNSNGYLLAGPNELDLESQHALDNMPQATRSVNLPSSILVKKK